MFVEFLFRQKRFSHKLHFEFVVQPIMSDEFLFVKKRFSHWLHFEFMVQPMMFVEFLFRQKTFLTFTALRVRGTPHDVCWISFSSKNVFHILCMVRHMMFCHFFYKKLFSHCPQASAHDFSSSVGIFNSPLLSENLKISNMWELFIVITTAVQTLLSHRPRMRSTRASVAHVQ